VPEPLSRVPDRILAGDTLVVALAEPSEYLTADGWTHALVLQGIDGTAANASASSTSGTVTFTVSAADTVSLSAGAATWAWTATKAGARYTLDRARVTVLADPAGDQSTSELAHIERVIAACQAKLEGKITDDVMMFQLPDGVMLQKLNMRDVRETLAMYKAKRRALLNGGRPRIREAWYASRY